MSLPKPRVSLRTHIRKFNDYLHGKHIGFMMAFYALVLVAALGSIVAAANGIQQVFPQVKAFETNTCGVTQADGSIGTSCSNPNKECKNQNGTYSCVDKTPVCTKDCSAGACGQSDGCNGVCDNYDKATPGKCGNPPSCDQSGALTCTDSGGNWNSSNCTCKQPCQNQTSGTCSACGGTSDLRCSSSTSAPITAQSCTGSYTVTTYTCNTTSLPTCTTKYPNATSENCDACGGKTNTAVCKTRIESATDEQNCTGSYNVTVYYCDSKPACNATTVGDCNTCGGLSDPRCTTKTTQNATNPNCSGTYTLTERICEPDTKPQCTDITAGDCVSCGGVGNSACITTVLTDQTATTCTGNFKKTTNQCQQTLPECTPEGISATSTCSGHGTVTQSAGTVDATCNPGYHPRFTCQCDSGYSGSQCGVLNCPDGDADNNGICGDQRSPCYDGVTTCLNGSIQQTNVGQQNASCFGGSTQTRSCSCINGYGGGDCGIPPAKLCPDTGANLDCGINGIKKRDNLSDLTCSGGFRQNTYCQCQNGYSGTSCQTAPIVLPSCTENQPTSTCTCDGSNRESKDGKCVTKSTNTCTAQDQSCTTSGGLAGRCLTDKGPCFYDPVASCRVAFPDCASGSLSKDPNGVCSCTEFALGNNCSPKCTGDKVCTSVGSTAIPSYACVKKTDCTAGQDASLCNCDLTLNVVTNGKCVAKTDNFTVYCKFGDNVSEKKCICTGSDRLVKNGVCVVSNINQICNTGERIAFRNCICDAGRDGSSGNCKDLPAPGYDQVNGVICLRPGVSTKNDGVGCCPGSQFNSDNKCTLYANLPTCPDSSVIVPNAIGNITSPCTCQSGTTYDASQNKCIRLTGGANGVCRDGDVWKRIDKDKNEIVTCQCSTPLRATPDGKCIKPTLTAGQSCAGKANQCVDGTQCYDLSVSGTNFFNIQPTCFGTIDFCTPIVINSITGEKLCFRLSDHPIADGIKQIGAISNVVNIIGSSLTGGVNALINISGNISAPNIEEVIKKCTAEAANEILKSGKKWEYLSSIAQQCIGTKGKEWFDKNIANSNLVTSVISACAGSQNALKPGAVWSELPLLVQTCIAGLVGNAEQWVTDNFTAPVRDNNGVVIVPGKAPKCDKEGNNGRVKTCICNADRAQSYCNFDPTKNPNCKPVDVIVDKKIVNKVYSCDYSKVTAIQTKKPLFTFATKTPSKNKIVLTATQAAIDSCTTLIQNNYLPSSVLPKDTGYLYPYGMQSFKIPCASDTVLQIATELKPGDAAKNWYVRKLGRIQPQNPDLIAYFTFDAARIFQYTENGKTYLVANIPLQNDIFGDDGYGDNQISGVFGFATDDTALTGSLNKTTLQYVNELRAQQAIDQGVINNANSSSGTNTSLQPNNPSSSKSVLTIIKTGGLATSIFFIIGSFALTGLVWYTLTLRKRQLKNIRNI